VLAPAVQVWRRAAAAKTSVRIAQRLDRLAAGRPRQQLQWVECRERVRGWRCVTRSVWWWARSHPRPPKAYRSQVRRNVTRT